MLSDITHTQQVVPPIIRDRSGRSGAGEIFIDAYKSGKFAHGWVLAGAKGIGKSDLSLRLAHYLLSHPQADTAPDQLSAQAPHDPVFGQIIAGSHPDLLVLRRQINTKTGKLKQDISVNEARGVSKFFSRRATGEGWRICIIDTADDLNRSAANALLKIVEEPPEKSLILFISHSLGRLIPTLRSRCRVLKCASLSEDDIMDTLATKDLDTSSEDTALIAALCEGSLSRAQALGENGLSTYREMLDCLHTLPEAEWGALNKFITSLSGATHKDKRGIFADLLTRALQRMIISSVSQDWHPALSQEKSLAQKWAIHEKLHSYSNFMIWLEKSLYEMDEYNLNTTLTLRQIFQKMAEMAKRGPAI